jgi:putative transposase
MWKAYKYRIYPTKKQESMLNDQLALCAELYNAAIQERRDAYRMCGNSITYTQHAAQLPEIKVLRPEYEAIYSQVLQEVLPQSKLQVGIDVGLKTFAYLSNGEQIENPRFFRIEAKRLAKASRGLSKVVKGTKARAKKRKVVARIHERIRWRRENFVHSESRSIVNRYGLIAVEALAVRNMVKRPKPKQDEATGCYLPNGASSKTGLNISIADAAWSAFFKALLFKVEETGRTMIKVPPAYTTQACHDCGHRQEMPLSVRVYTCEQCGVTYDRDHNASLNILHTAIGRDGVALGT